LDSTGLNAFADAILSRSDTKDPGKIGLLAEIFARHCRDDSDNALRLSGERHEQMMLAVERWADALLSSAESTRSQLANVARAIERLSDPKLVLTLQCLLAEDLARWKQSREELLAAHQKAVDQIADRFRADNVCGCCCHSVSLNGLEDRGDKWSVVERIAFGPQ
jgi:hypothetical protein